MDRLRIGDLDVAYRRAGSGPPLVILPGALDDGRWWLRQLADLSSSFTVVVWDAPGCGESDDPAADWTLGDFADCAARLVEALGLPPVHLLGLSFGSALAIEVYRRHPGIVRTLVLVSAYAGWAGSLPADEVEARVAGAARMVEMSADERVAAWLPTLFASALPPAIEAEAVELIGTARTAVAPTLARALAVDLRAVLPTITVPTLIVAGDRDVRSPPGVAADLRASIAGSDLVVVEGAGHLVNVEAPERFAAAVSEFCARR
jgi:pimeloyl-ACP methyl ester carboxylesterase